MTAHIEAAPSDGPSGNPVIRHNWLFLPLFAPFGISAGYVSVMLAFQLSTAGLATGAVAALVAMTIWPQTWKILWAPVVDTIGNPKLWYGLGAALVGLTILLTSLHAHRSELPLLGLLIVISSIASTFVSMSAEIFMANFTRPEDRGKVSGWAQTGNVGGSGVGGGLGLIIAERVTHPWIAGALVALVCFACWAAVLALPPAPKDHRPLNYFASVRQIVIALWELVLSRKGALGLFLMILPIGSGGLQGVSAAIAGEWGAGADLVAGVGGIGSGLASSAGCLAAGWLCDRLGGRMTYALSGLVCGLFAVAMAYAPRDATMYALFLLLYAVALGGCYAAYNAIVLDAIGKGAAATKFNLFAALSNVPLAWMTERDGLVHDSHGTIAMLWLELAAPALAVAVFAALVFLTRPRRAATA